MYVTKHKSVLDDMSHTNRSTLTVRGLTRYKAIVWSVLVCIRGMQYGAPPGLTCRGAIAVLTCSSTVHIHVQLYSCTRTVPDTVPVHTSTSIQLLLYSCTRSLLQLYAVPRMCIAAAAAPIQACRRQVRRGAEASCRRTKAT